SSDLRVTGGKGRGAASCATSPRVRPRARIRRGPALRWVRGSGVRLVAGPSLDPDRYRTRVSVGGAPRWRVISSGGVAGRPGARACGSPTAVAAAGAAAMVYLGDEWRCGDDAWR